MNRDQFDCKWSELQVHSGKFTDDKLMQTEGTTTSSRAGCKSGTEIEKKT
jgi:uncharacterized protein YjbJ (UPF0337 family)